MADGIDIEREFSLDDDLIYLNHAGVGPWPRRAAEAAEAFARINIERGAAEYPEWTARQGRLRERLAELVDAASPDHVALVQNTSEGLSLIAEGLDWQPGDNVVINDQEFVSNRWVWEALSDRGVEVRDVRLDPAAPESALVAAMDERTRLLPVSAVQYGTGLRMDLDRLGRACREVGALFCVDAIQALGALEFSARAVGADFVVADGHKWLLGPEALGVLYVAPEVMPRLRLTRIGWHMVEAMGEYDRRDWQPATSARRFEAGSPNTLGAYVLEASLSLLQDIGMAEVERRVLERSHYLFDRIDAEPALERITDRAPGRHAGIVTFRVPRGPEPNELLKALRAGGIPCAARGGGIRFSPHFHTPLAQLDRAIDRVLELRKRR